MGDVCLPHEKSQLLVMVPNMAYQRFHDPRKSVASKFSNTGRARLA